ncbi:SLATT domain-containing protein [Pedobacter aquatilis]|uniref:SLATT domain-containing protein n=1 Tax=Pedobacter aquatilis TaxID=351343 RepID=UPI00292D648A|nr:SLATT domain-containing protein [Pedobacter aquatilis]
MTEKETQIIAEMKKEIRIKRNDSRREYKCYYAGVNIYRKRHKLMGASAVILSTLAGSAFLTHTTVQLKYADYLASMLSLLAALMTGLNTFYGFSETINSFANSGRRWYHLRDRYTSFLIEIDRYQGEDEDAFQKLLDRYHELSDICLKIREESIPIPGWLFTKFENTIDKAEGPEFIHSQLGA